MRDLVMIDVDQGLFYVRRKYKITNKIIIVWTSDFIFHALDSGFRRNDEKESYLKFVSPAKAGVQLKKTPCF